MYSAENEFKKLVAVIDDDRLRRFAIALKHSKPVGFTSGRPLIKCRDINEDGNLVDTLKSIEGAMDIRYMILDMSVKQEIYRRFINKSQVL